jgi:hypothetical protein
MDPMDPDSDPQHWYISWEMFFDPGSKFKPTIILLHVVRHVVHCATGASTCTLLPTLANSKRTVPLCDFFGSIHNIAHPGIRAIRL